MLVQARCDHRRREVHASDAASKELAQESTNSGASSAHRFTAVSASIEREELVNDGRRERAEIGYTLACKMNGKGVADCLDVDRRVGANPTMIT